MGVRRAPGAQVGGLGLLRGVTGAGSEGRAFRERGEKRQSPLGPAPAPRSGLSQQPPSTPQLPPETDNVGSGLSAAKLGP